jgi:hypothetical protein
MNNIIDISKMMEVKKMFDVAKQNKVQVQIRFFKKDKTWIHGIGDVAQIDLFPEHLTDKFLTKDDLLFYVEHNKKIRPILVPLEDLISYKLIKIISETST